MIERRSATPHVRPDDPRGILRGRDILCFGQDWDADPFSRTHVMRLLARDNRLLWIDSIGYRTPTVSRADLKRAFTKLAAVMLPVREVEPNIHVLNPLTLPLCGPRAQCLNRHLLRLQLRRALRRLGFRRPISWVFNPAAAVVAGTLGEQCHIDRCVDEFTAFTGVDREALAALERDLLRKSDLVIVSAQMPHGPRARLNSNTVVVRHGVDHEHFCKALDPGTTVPRDIARLPPPVIGFFGLIADWVDLDLLTHVASRFPEGPPARPQAVRGRARVLQGLRRRRESLPAQHADAPRQPPQGPRVFGRRPPGRLHRDSRGHPHRPLPDRSRSRRLRPRDPGGPAGSGAERSPERRDPARELGRASRSDRRSSGAGRVRHIHGRWRSSKVAVGGGAWPNFMRIAPCLTLRNGAERPVTVTDGTNMLVGLEPARSLAGWRDAIDRLKPGRVPPLWDGRTARRLLDVLDR